MRTYEEKLAKFRALNQGPVAPEVLADLAVMAKDNKRRARRRITDKDYRARLKSNREVMGIKPRI